MFHFFSLCIPSKRSDNARQIKRHGAKTKLLYTSPFLSLPSLESNQKHSYSSQHLLSIIMHEKVPIGALLIDSPLDSYTSAHSSLAGARKHLLSLNVLLCPSGPFQAFFYNLPRKFTFRTVFPQIFIRFFGGKSLSTYTVVLIPS